jgi:ubiquinone/menaquinone biosynthesis C-methylase UbiE
MSANQGMAGPANPDKVERVRSFFDRTNNYLPKRWLDIRLRAETIRDLTKDGDFKDILDIGCGSGAISAPLLNPQRHLTLLDLSSNMLSIARSQIPAELAPNVEFVNQDFLAAEFKPSSFDLVICLGVLAHVNSPSDTLARVASVLRPGGTLILEWTDSRHLMGRINWYYNSLAALIAPPTYQVNLLSSAEVISIAKKHGFCSISEYRYALPLPKTAWMVTPADLYRMTRLVFGEAGHNRNAWLGNQHIHRFTRS